MHDQLRIARFEQAVLPHLDAAYNLARWLTGSDHDAEDVVQEAYLRALQFFDGFRGGDGRSWLLTIVRNTTFTWLEKNRPRVPTVAFQEQVHGGEGTAPGPPALLLKKEDQERVRRAVEQLPLEFREVVVLRDLEGLSYKEVAAVTGIPMGTVMSRLARARDRLEQTLIGNRGEES